MFEKVTVMAVGVQMLSKVKNFALGPYGPATGIDLELAYADGSASAEVPKHLRSQPLVRTCKHIFEPI